MMSWNQQHKRDARVPMAPKKDVIILLPYSALQSNQILNA